MLGFVAVNPEAMRAIVELAINIGTTFVQSAIIGPLIFLKYQFVESMRSLIIAVYNSKM